MSPKEGVHEKQISFLHPTSFIYLFFHLLSAFQKKAKKRRNKIKKKKRGKERKNNTDLDSLAKQKKKPHKKRGREPQDVCILILRSCLRQGSCSPLCCSDGSVCAPGSSQPRKIRFRAGQGHFIAGRIFSLRGICQLRPRT